ncbi:Transposase [Prosthecobacter debontii]|uniref:Transposase n=1 Tax=Prosthecobacter debontii TaxID=48467 RepID=A0A1T4Z5Y9_9BACT|nr:IS66 family transposase [Prosthecobacter debontii]SKB09460.1 Transposase [Prosthecobacter debontii]
MTPLEARLTAENEAQRLEIKLLREKIDLLVRRVFGRSSEAMDDAQLMLLLQGDDGAKKDPASSANPGVLEAELEKQAESAKPQKRRKEREARIPEHLPVIEEVIEPEPVKAAPEAWRCMGEEVTEQLDYEPAKFLRRRIIRPKYVKREEPHQPPIIAPLTTLQERSIAAPGLLAAIIVGKYGDQLPLYRQEQIYSTRHGVDIPRQSMARWLALAADWLTPMYDHIRSSVMATGYVQIDETPVAYLSPGHGQTQQGYLWTCKRPRADVCFTWARTRSGTCLGNIIPTNFSGTVQCDGYAAYPAFARSRAGLTLAGCWAHARRKFYEAKDSAPQQAGWVLLQIAHLYRIEARLRESRAGPRLRQAVRAAESRPIIERLNQALRRLKLSRRHLPKSAFGRAMDYALSLMPMLEVYANDGHVEIDNNLVENSIRPTAIGKKNWLFIGDADAGQRSAILYTLIESCRARSLDPWAYLRDVLTRLPTMTNRQVKDVTPKAWAEALQQKLKAA